MPPLAARAVSSGHAAVSEEIRPRLNLLACSVNPVKTFIRFPPCRIGFLTSGPDRAPSLKYNDLGRPTFPPANVAKTVRVPFCRPHAKGDRRLAAVHWSWAKQTAG